MDMNSANIEQIVKQVLAQMGGGAAPAKSVGGPIPKTARVAMLTKLEHFDVREFPIPELGDDDILVKVEGCGVCGTDAHEFKRDPFGLIPVALGHEGTGEIVKMGKNVKKDSAQECTTEQTSWKSSLSSHLWQSHKDPISHGFSNPHQLSSTASPECSVCR